MEQLQPRRGQTAGRVARWQSRGARTSGGTQVVHDDAPAHHRPAWPGLLGRGHRTTRNRRQLRRVRPRSSRQTPARDPRWTGLIPAATCILLGLAAALYLYAVAVQEGPGTLA